MGNLAEPTCVSFYPYKLGQWQPIFFMYILIMDFYTDTNHRQTKFKPFGRLAQRNDQQNNKDASNIDHYYIDKTRLCYMYLNKTHASSSKFPF